MRAVQDTALKVQHAHALEYAQKVASFASSFVDEHRRAALGASERESGQCRIENDRRVNEQPFPGVGFREIACRALFFFCRFICHCGAGQEAGEQFVIRVKAPRFALLFSRWRLSQ